MIGRFFVLACALSWLAWMPLVLASSGWIDATPSPYLHLVGGLGPALAGLVLTALEGRRSLTQLARRCVLGPPRWIAAAVAAPVALYGVAALILRIAGFEVDLAATGAGTEYPALGVAGYALANLVFYGFGEEVGWRGYALPRMEERWGPRVATAWLALGWAVWHLPLFVFSHGMAAMGPLEVLGWLASLVTGAYLMTWLFHRSRGSVLPVALFHATLDVLINSPIDGPLPPTMGALVTIAGIAAVVAVSRAPRPAPSLLGVAPGGGVADGGVGR